MKNLMISFNRIDDHFQWMEVRKDGAYKIYKVGRTGMPFRKMLRSAVEIELINFKNKLRKMWN